jgi:hypothetical protein
MGAQRSFVTLCLKIAKDFLRLGHFALVLGSIFVVLSDFFFLKYVFVGHYLGLYLLQNLNWVLVRVLFHYIADLRRYQKTESGGIE